MYTYFFTKYDIQNLKYQLCHIKESILASFLIKENVISYEF